MPSVLSAWRKRRQARTDMAVLGCILAGDIYVLDMWGRLGGNAGRIHLALDRLKRQGLVWSAWVEGPRGIPPRVRYGLTVRALRSAELHRESQQSLGAMTEEDRELLERTERMADLYRRIEAQTSQMLAEIEEGSDTRG